MTALSTLLNFGPEHAMSWLTPPVLPGLLVGLGLGLGLAFAPRRLVAALGLVALTLLIMLVTQAGTDPYFSLSLTGWERGRFIRFHGLWDLDELYDLTADPLESRNLLAEPGHKNSRRRWAPRCSPNWSAPAACRFRCVPIRSVATSFVTPTARQGRPSRNRSSFGNRQRGFGAGEGARRSHVPLSRSQQLRYAPARTPIPGKM